MVQILPQRKNFYNSLIEGSASAAQDIGTVYKRYQEKKKLSALGEKLAKEFGQPELAPLFAQAAATKPEELVKSLVSFGNQKRLSELTRQLTGEGSPFGREEPSNISNDHDEYRPHSLGSLIGGDNFQAPPQRSLPGMGQDMNRELNASSQRPNLPKLDTGGVMHEPQMFGNEGISDKEDMGPLRENPGRRAILDEIAARNPALGAYYERVEKERNRAMEAYLNRQLANRKITSGEEAAKYKYNQKFNENIDKSFLNYQDLNLHLDELENLANKGNLTTPLTASLLERFGLSLGVLNNPDSEAFQKTSQDLLKGISAYYGNRLNLAEVNSFLKTIPTLLNSEEGRKQIIKNMRIFSEPAQILYESREKLLKQLNGKPPPYDFQSKVIADALPRITKLSDRFKEDLPVRLQKGDRIIEIPRSEKDTIKRAQDKGYSTL